MLLLLYIYTYIHTSSAAWPIGYLSRTVVFVMFPSIALHPDTSTHREACDFYTAVVVDST